MIADEWARFVCVPEFTARSQLKLSVQGRGRFSCTQQTQRQMTHPARTSPAVPERLSCLRCLFASAASAPSSSPWPSPCSAVTRSRAARPIACASSPSADVRFFRFGMSCNPGRVRGFALRFVCLVSASERLNRERQ